MMQTDLFEIKPYTIEYKEQVVAVWEQSVLATHTFLTPEDFKEIKQIVAAMDFHAFPVFCLLHEGSVVGFMGVDGPKVEMLFVLPAFCGKGLGKKLLNYALHHLGATKVDVNEQNGNALAFYKKMGFETYERTEQDGLGKNYPILKMQLSTMKQ